MAFIDSNRGTCTPSSIDEDRVKRYGAEFDDSSVHESSSPSSDEDTSTSKIVGASNGNDNNNSPINEMTKLAANENKQVNRWRRIVIISILVVGAIVCSITYVTLKQAQVDDSKGAVRLLLHSFHSIIT
jgi:hypothetical protein